MLVFQLRFLQIRERLFVFMSVFQIHSKYILVIFCKETWPAIHKRSMNVCRCLIQHKNCIHTVYFKRMYEINSYVLKSWSDKICIGVYLFLTTFFNLPAKPDFFRPSLIYPLPPPPDIPKGGAIICNQPYTSAAEG